LLYGGTKLKKILVISVIILIILTTSCSSQEYEVNIETEPEDAGEVIGGGTYEVGEKVELIAIPKEGHDFSSWEMDGEIVSEEQAFKITVDSDKNVRANFKRLKEDIYATVKIKKGREIVLGPFTEKEKINLSANEGILQEFMTWVVNGKTVSKEKEFEYLLGDEDVYIEAVYKNLEQEIDGKIEVLKQNISEEEWETVEKNLKEIIAMYKGDTSKSIDEIIDEIFISWNNRRLLNESDEILK
jgi:flagellar hook-associated protein FlgK